MAVTILTCISDCLLPSMSDGALNVTRSCIMDHKWHTIQVTGEAATLTALHAAGRVIR